MVLLSTLQSHTLGIGSDCLDRFSLGSGQAVERAGFHVALSKVTMATVPVSPHGCMWLASRHFHNLGGVRLLPKQTVNICVAKTELLPHQHSETCYWI